MKKLLIFLVVMGFVAATFGCAKYKLVISAINQASKECSNSTIYKLVPLPEISSGVIQISLNQFIKANEGYRTWAMSINNKAIELVDDPTTTNDKFATEITAQTMQINKWWGSELVRLAGPVFAALTGNYEVMDQCDRELIRTFCKQRLEHWQSVAFLSPTHRFVLEKGYQFLSDVLPGSHGSDGLANIAICALTDNGRQNLAGCD